MTIVSTDRRKNSRSELLPPPPPQAVEKALGVSGITIEWLAGDGSDRCYYRLISPAIKESLVLMQLSGQDAQALRDDGYDWIKIASLLFRNGVFVPRVIASLPEHAALIIEDYGDTMLEGRIFTAAAANDQQTIVDLYRDALQIVTRFLAIPQEEGATWCKRAFDAERFAWELRFFMQQYAVPVAKVELTRTEQAAFEIETERLATTLAANSRYFVHRDFHSRNVMVKDGKLAVIDFQDARLGPAAYDIVSLCFDSYVPFSPALRRQLLEGAIAMVRSDLGETVANDVEALWKPMLLQRQLKAIGSFGYLTLDKKRGDYLKYVGPALATMEEQGLEDERWPLISSVLIRRLRAFLTP